MIKREFWLSLLIITVNFAFLLYGASTLSISYHEALTYFEGNSIAHYLSNLSTSFFGQKDLALRIPFIITHLITMLLFYKISGFYLKREEDRVFSLFIYSLLPGVNSAALLVYNAVFVIFFNLFLPLK